MPSRKKRKKQDGGMVAKTLEFLATQQDIYAERRNSGSIKVGERLIKLGEAGTFDITGYMLLRGQYAIPFEIECKSSTGELRKSQRKRIEMLNKLNVPYAMVRTLSDVLMFVDGLRGRKVVVA